MQGVRPKLPIGVLPQIHALAAMGSVKLQRPVQSDVENLEYDHGDVCECLCNLTEQDFTKRHAAGWDPNIPLFAFETRYESDDLYIKIQLTPTVIEVYSFKLEGSPR